MHDMHEMQLRYNPNILNAMKMRYLEVRARGRADRGNGKIRCNENEMPRNACTQARKPGDDMCLEMRARGHANRGDGMCLEIRARGHANRGDGRM